MQFSVTCRIFFEEGFPLEICRCNISAQLDNLIKIVLSFRQKLVKRDLWLIYWALSKKQRCNVLQGLVLGRGTVWHPCLFPPNSIHNKLVYLSYFNVLLCKFVTYFNHVFFFDIMTKLFCGTGGPRRSITRSHLRELSTAASVRGLGVRPHVDEATDSRYLRYLGR